MRPITSSIDGADSGSEDGSSRPTGLPSTSFVAAAAYLACTLAAQVLSQLHFCSQCSCRSQLSACLVSCWTPQQCVMQRWTKQLKASLSRDACRAKVQPFLLVCSLYLAKPVLCLACPHNTACYCCFSKRRNDASGLSTLLWLIWWMQAAQSHCC